MQPLQEITKLARKYPDLIELGSGASDKQLAEVERRLGAKLPAFYRDYLKRFGVIAIGSEEFLGWVGDVDAADDLNVVAAKSRLAKEPAVTGKPGPGAG